MEEWTRTEGWVLVQAGRALAEVVFLLALTFVSPPTSPTALAACQDLQGAIFLHPLAEVVQGLGG